MIRQNIYLERAHGWRVTCYFAVTHYEVEEIMQRLIEAGCEGDNLQTAYDNLCSDSLNTGLCYSGNGESVLVVSCATSPSQLLNSIFHESHHLSSMIAKALGWDLMGEEVCYLSGEIGQQMHPVVSHYLCGHCRSNV
jgi:hypothetical protein